MDLRPTVTKKVVGVFVRFRAPLQTMSRGSQSRPILACKWTSPQRTDDAVKISDYGLAGWR
jgi:hypothetical protein